MKKSCITKIAPTCPLILSFLLCASPDVRASILFSENFETDGEGTRYTSTSSFSDGGNDYFTRTDGSTEASGIPAFTSFQDNWFWAAEDVDSSDNPSGQALLDFSGIALNQFNSIRISLDIGAGSNTAFDSANDFLLVQYRVDAGSWATALAFQNDGNAFNTGLYHDLDMDGIGDGPLVDLSLQAFSSALIPVSGEFLDLRIDTFMTGDAEAIAFDNIQVTGVPEPATSALLMAALSACLLLYRRNFLPHRENESRA